MTVLDLLNSPWAIRPEMLRQMAAIYQSHINGETPDFPRLRAQLGQSTRSQNYTVQDGVAVIPLEGIISKRVSLLSDICGGTSTHAFQEMLAAALADPSVMAIILDIDSPGGNVDGVQAAADAVYNARTRKPIVSLVDGEMASAAYWIGSAASKIYTSSDTDVVGSIGIVTQHIDTSNLEYQRGVRITDITAGKYKRIATQHAPLSQEGRETIQDQLDHVYGVFVDAVARNRGVSAGTVLSRMADGRVFRGKQAIDAGLVDAKTSLPSLIRQLSETRSTTQQRKPNRNSGSSAREPGPMAVPKIAALPSASRCSASADLTRSPVDPRIQKLRILKAEQADLETQLGRAIQTQKDATTNLWLGQQMHRGWKELVPAVAQKKQATETIRALRMRLAANGRAQSAALEN